ncbi:unnamed protein product, partial [Prorocentrum cordatum]
ADIASAVGLMLTCADSSCSAASSGYLGYTCDADGTDGNKTDGGSSHTASASFNGSGAHWQLVLDTSSLEPGGEYLLCVDFDGPGTDLGFVPASSSTVWMNPLRPRLPWTIQSAVAQSISFDCVGSCSTDAVGSTNASESPNATREWSACGCSEVTVAYLGTSCAEDTWDSNLDAISGVRTEVAPITRQGRTTDSYWSAILNASQLLPGMYYRLCLDLDGSSSQAYFREVESDAVFITPVLAASRGIMLTSQSYTYGQVLTLVGSLTNTSGATLYLATACELGNNSSSNVDQTGLSTAPAEMLGTAVDFDTRVIVFTAAGEPSLVATGDASVYQVILDTTSLVAGLYYAVCVDLDGAGASYNFSDVGLRVFASDIVVQGPVHREEHALLPFACSRGCTTAATAFLAADCSSEEDATAASPFARLSCPSALSAAASCTAPWVVGLDTSALKLGVSYALCVDMDGAGGAFSAGDTGRRVYLSGLSGLAEHPAWSNATALVVRLSCRVGECSGAMRAHLATACDPADTDGDAEAEAGIRTG